MTAYQQGDVDAFAELVARHEKPLWSFLRRLTRDDALAEDLLQETFMRVIRGASAWRAEAKFTSWLYTIARNLCIDQARRRQYAGTVSLDGQSREEDSSPGLHERVAGGDLGAERMAHSRELGARLERALAELPEAQREVFLMREVLALPFAEIAQVVGSTEATIKSPMRYALERLRGALTDVAAASDRPCAEVEP